MRAVEVIESTFVPLPGAKFSMCTTMAFDRQIPRKCSRGRLHGLANVVDQALDQCWIVALGHHADQGFGPRLGEDEAALALELGFGGGNPLPDTIRLERLAAAVEADVFKQLRQG